MPGAGHTKHPGFHEEREWRVCFVSKTNLSGSAGNLGKPQLVALLPLQNVPSEDLTGLSIPELINRIIIGPTEYPSALYQAFVTLLKGAGVADAEQRVVVSEIPIRRPSA